MEKQRRRKRQKRCPLVLHVSALARYHRDIELARKIRGDEDMELI
jgi:hypothetical protein